MFYLVMLIIWFVSFCVIGNLSVMDASLILIAGVTLVTLILTCLKKYCYNSLDDEVKKHLEDY